MGIRIYFKKILKKSHQNDGTFFYNKHENIQHIF